MINGFDISGHADLGHRRHQAHEIIMINDDGDSGHADPGVSVSVEGFSCMGMASVTNNKVYRW
jgi:hypothetical protein